MIRTTYRSEKNPSPRDGAMKRYVRCDAHFGFVWCEKQERSRFDYSQGTCEAADIPPSIRESAEAQRGRAFSYVDWPETETV